MVTKTLHPSQATKDDLLQASKAIYDQTKSLVDARLDEAEINTALRLQSILEKKLEFLFREILENRLQEFYTEQEARVSSLHTTYQTGVDHLTTLIQSLSTPTINVIHPDIVVNVPTQEAPQVNFTPANVIVNVPEQQAPAINVQIPLQEAPIVNVQIPLQEVPTVNVTVPQPRLIKKVIQYDEYGRPTHIEEKES